MSAKRPTAHAAVVVVGGGAKAAIKRAAGQSAGKLILDARGAADNDMVEGLVAFASKSGFGDIRVEVSAHRLGRDDAGRFARAGAGEVCITLHAATREAFASIAGSAGSLGSCYEALAAAAAVPKLDLQARIPVCDENAGELTKIIGKAMSAGAWNFILDMEETRARWPAGRVKYIFGEIEKAVRYCVQKGAAVSLKGREAHQVTAFSDGRFEKEKEDEHFLLTYFRPGRRRVREVFSADLRLTYRCNQNCVFCAAARRHTEPDHALMRSRLERLLGRGLQRLCIDGGEPTLSKHLMEYLRMASGGGVREILLMTNGVRASNPDFAREICLAGANRIFVSLHAHTRKLSDEITGLEGSFASTVKGVSNFLSCGVKPYLIFVMLSKNLRTLPEYVRFVAREFGGAPVLLSMVTPYLSPSLKSDLIPRYSELRPVFDEAMAAAGELGVCVTGMEEQHRPPECALPGAGRIFRNLFAPLEYGEKIEGFVKPERCFSCALDAACPGVREFYARAHGTSEIKPLKKAVS